jgi:hypothetical protein
VLAKRSDRGKEGVLPRIDWLAWVCGCSRQDGLGGRLENKIFCPLSGRDGQDRLVKRCGHRFWAGCTGYCVGNLSDLLSKRQDGEDELGIRGRAQRMGRMWRGKGDGGRLGKDGLGETGSA